MGHRDEGPEGTGMVRANGPGRGELLTRLALAGILWLMWLLFRTP